MRTALTTAIVIISLVSVAVWARSGSRSATNATAKRAQRGKMAKRTNFRKLPDKVARIVEGCGTEPPFTGKYLNHKKKGTYTCTRCSAPLFASSTKFRSGSGWPSFDQALPGAVREVRDPDGRRTEIQCRRCSGHLGHVFRGERMTPKNTRHCVNSLSLGFTAAPLAEAFYAGGCFWGVEHLLEHVKGVVRAESGYMGGLVQAPTYKQVCTTDTGHAETVRVLFNPKVVSYETLTKRFFEIHDPTQVNRQGPDRGKQYRSAIFVTDSKQEKTVKQLIALLKKKGLRVVTEVKRADKFWPAEAYHQDYYVRTGKKPYCHAYKKRF